MAESTTIAPAVSASGHQMTASPAASQRLMSVDALRGFDMFWIVGADEIFLALNKMFKSQPMPAIMNQLDHCEWEGFHFEDFIFPLFVFLMGASVVFSLTKIIAQEGRGAAVKRVIRRFVFMFVLALIYSGGFSKNWPDMRLMGVLNRIALCYLFGSLIFVFFKPKAIIGIAASLLLGYWALLAWVPFPDVRPTPGVGIINRTNAPTLEQINLESTTMIHGSYIQGVNLTDYLDQKYLPGRKYDGTYDPEGFLSTMPAIVTCLLGIFAGLLLKNAEVCPTRKVVYLISFGIGSVLLGYLWGTQFPVIKKIWTSSYVLVAGGYGAILLGVFYWIVDILKFQAWCQPFVWMGMNSITIYFIHGFIVSFPRLSTRLVGGDIEDFLNNHWTGLGDLLVALVATALTFWLLHFLHRRKIFLRL
jgi:predicted acyltransferase